MTLILPGTTVGGAVSEVTVRLTVTRLGEPSVPGEVTSVKVLPLNPADKPVTSI